MIDVPYKAFKFAEKKRYRYKNRKTDQRTL